MKSTTRAATTLFRHALAITGLGHDQPTILVTNGVGPLADTSAKKIIEHYAQRMNIEQRLAES
ncbi:MAG TPA: hypothetical protein VFC19_00555, partial [Candidatus Limnocylindrales bacterium]|nr:hypothetical protein [Candidatus Limnocylindrales bacterium]